MTLWTACHYIPCTDNVYAGTYPSPYTADTLLELAAALGITHLQFWQRQWNETSPYRYRLISSDALASFVTRMKDYNLQPAVCLSTTPSEAADLVQHLGSDCQIYEICCEPHLKAGCNCSSASIYASTWNSVVAACRTVNPTAMYGGPAVGVTPTSQSWMATFLQACDCDFASYHLYTYQALTGEQTTQAWLLANAVTKTTSTFNTYKNMATSYGKPNLSILITEAYYTSGTNPDYSGDQTFLNNYITALFDTCKTLGVHSIWMWDFIGYNNLFCMVTQPPTYTIKNYYRAVQSYIASETTGTKQASFNASLMQQQVKQASFDAGLISQQVVEANFNASLEVSPALCSWGTPSDEQWDMFHHMGDVNDDGVIDATDVALMQAAITVYGLTGICDELCDLNHDGKNNIFDALFIVGNMGKTICAMHGLLANFNASLQSSGMIEASFNADLLSQATVEANFNATLESPEGITIAPYFATLKKRLENVTMPHRSNLDESPTRLLDQGPELHLDVGLDSFERLKQQFKKTRASDSFERLKQRLKKAR